MNHFLLQASELPHGHPVPQGGDPHLSAAFRSLRVTYSNWLIDWDLVAHQSVRIVGDRDSHNDEPLLPCSTTLEKSIWKAAINKELYYDSLACAGLIAFTHSIGFICVNICLFTAIGLDNLVPAIWRSRCHLVAGIDGTFSSGVKAKTTAAFRTFHRAIWWIPLHVVVSICAVVYGKTIVVMVVRIYRLDNQLWGYILPHKANGVC